MLLAAAAAVLALTAPSHRPFDKRRRHSTRTHSVAAGGRMTWNLLKLAMRHELLRDFLVEARSERPAFVDARTGDVGQVLRVGPTSGDVDFLGAPIARARVVNDSGRVLDAIVVVSVEDAHGASVHASTWIEGLAPHAERAVELYCPTSLEPAAVRWSVTPL